MLIGTALAIGAGASKVFGAMSAHRAQNKAWEHQQFLRGWKHVENTNLWNRKALVIKQQQQENFLAQSRSHGAIDYNTAVALGQAFKGQETITRRGIAGQKGLSVKGDVAKGFSRNKDLEMLLQASATRNAAMNTVDQSKYKHMQVYNQSKTLANKLHASIPPRPQLGPGIPKPEKSWLDVANVGLSAVQAGMGMASSLQDAGAFGSFTGESGQLENAGIFTPRNQVISGTSWGT